jgi:hypothetical protein
VNCLEDLFVFSGAIANDSYWGELHEPGYRFPTSSSGRQASVTGGRLSLVQPNVIDEFTFLNDEIDNWNAGGTNGVNVRNRTSGATEATTSYAGSQLEPIAYRNGLSSSSVQQLNDDVFGVSCDTADLSNQVSFDEEDLEREQIFVMGGYDEALDNDFAADQAWLNEHVDIPSMFVPDVSEAVIIPPKRPGGGKATSKTIHRCTQCGTTCSRKSDLKRHTRRHDTSAPRYPCQRCAMAFLRKDKLRDHQRYMGH